ncbi:protein of unknown function [Candidatus Nitrotoga arctica]|uniref:Uncharacterized protein n=1 Tax=Candidatus Nitrotoga arctica TaxID=453162 RepID=A0ABM8YZK9_9PROT|nr:protein of unknown function [Candidatus Nitrotoga arctica]
MIGHMSKSGVLFIVRRARPYGYQAEALTGVYFGPDMPFATCEIIALILAGQNTHVQLWQGSRSESTFAVEFRSVNYTSYLDLKRLGPI